MNLDSPDRQARMREYANCLAQLSNVLWAMQHKPGTWDERMQALQAVRDSVVLAMRYVIYFKNTSPGVKPDVPGLLGPNG